MDVQSVTALRNAIDDCSDRGLIAASKWASDLLQYVPYQYRVAATTQSPNPAPPSTDPPEEIDAMRTAKGFFWSKEFARAAHVLRDCKSPKARFMALYSQFLATERKASEDFERAISRSQAGKASSKDYPRLPYNPTISSIVSSLTDCNDPFLLFLKAVMLQRLNRRPEAIEALIHSVTAYPWNWSAWKLLSLCFSDRIEFANIRPLLPSHPVLAMLQIIVGLDRQCLGDEDLEECDKLLTVFPNCPMIIGWKAHILYHLKELEQAEVLFDAMLVKDPYRIEGIDIYSAILFVLRRRTKLSKLARRFSGMSRDRPEVCCVIGDHYSIRGEHEKAIKYYQRAVLLDRTCLGAWTLLGHSYVEMKNAHAAIEAYRRAIDITPQDPRAWFGLGQAYALLCMYQYSLYYYHRSVSLKPQDPRIWQELASCYTKLDKLHDALGCLLRAYAVASKDDIIIKHKLASTYETLGDDERAIRYNMEFINTCERTGRGIAEYARSCIVVAQLHAKRGYLEDVEVAIKLLRRVANSNAEENGSAKDALEKLERAKQDVVRQN